MNDDDVNHAPFACTESEIAQAAYELGMEHLAKAFENLSKFAEYRNFRLEFERRGPSTRPGNDQWARITIVPEPDPAAQVPCGLCLGGGLIDGRDCLVCEGRGTVHESQEYVVSVTTNVEEQTDGNPGPA